MSVTRLAITALLTALVASLGGSAAVAQTRVSEDPAALSHRAVASLSWDGKSWVISKGWTDGWSRGTIQINLELHYKSKYSSTWDKLYDRWFKCTSCYSLSTPTYYNCANPGTYLLYNYAYGPNGQASDFARVDVPLFAQEHHTHSPYAGESSDTDDMDGFKAQGFTEVNTSVTSDQDGPTSVTVESRGRSGSVAVETYLRNTGVRLTRASGDGKWAMHGAQQDITFADAAANGLLRLFELRRVRVDAEQFEEIQKLGRQVVQRPWRDTRLSLAGELLPARRIDTGNGWVIVAINPATDAPVVVSGIPGTKVPALS